ncbi:unnamed protein product [Meganyctiphanes norvegica]|uniref:Uncharacterized protein n=1 Tax=Meganyctiphanes norvegica TaxID=48144 RepID=A0AAV2RMS8_MEGNR
MYRAEFIFKNKRSGRYIHRCGKQFTTLEHEPLWLWDCLHPRAHYVFEQVDNEWGYIHPKESDEFWHPVGGQMNTTTNGEELHLHPSKPRHAMFAIDQVNGYIIHRDGLYVHYAAGTDPCPPNGDRIILHQDKHEGMTWEFLNPSNTSEEVNVYGSANILGDWKMLFAVEKSLAELTIQFKYKVGKSHPESTSSAFQFGWEASVSAKCKFAQMSTSTSITKEIENSSPETWSEEVEQTDTVKVVPGETVVVWQRVFIGTHLGHKAVFQSSHFTHTKDIDVKPVGQETD